LNWEAAGAAGAAGFDSVSAGSCFEAADAVSDPGAGAVSGVAETETESDRSAGAAAAVALAEARTVAAAAAAARRAESVATDDHATGTVAVVAAAAVVAGMRDYGLLKRVRTMPPGLQVVVPLLKMSWYCPAEGWKSGGDCDGS